MPRLPLYHRGRLVAWTEVDPDAMVWARHLRLSLRKDGYAGTPTKLFHRLIMGCPPSRVDHIDHDPLNNRRSNLRLASAAQNAFNAYRHRDNQSGFKGVYFDKQTQMWRSQIMANGKRYSLGRFATAKEAAAAYDIAASNLHGEFARLNGAT